MFVGVSNSDHATPRAAVLYGPKDLNDGVFRLDITPSIR